MSGGTYDEEKLAEAAGELYRKGATDGLPVVPPTEPRIEEMLKGTDLSANEVIGEMGTREGKLTVEKLAANGVMAGCLPIHMPLLIAGARTLADPNSNAIQTSVSTGSWAYLFIVNGPIREDIDINSDTGAFGPGFLSNKTVSRALGLAYKNSALIHPGEKEMSTIGNPFKFSLLAGENEERSPWDPLHVEYGYDESDSTITFAAPNSFLQTGGPPSGRSHDPKGVLTDLINNTPPVCYGIETDTANEKYEGFQTEVYYALSPYNAQELEGHSKAEIKEHICKNSHIPVEEYVPAESFGATGVSLDTEGETLPNIQIPQFSDPERIQIFVTGGSGRWNAVMGPALGGPTTKKVPLPGNWENLLERYKSRLERSWGGNR